jgi:hypothetical protein
MGRVAVRVGERRDDVSYFCGIKKIMEELNCGRWAWAWGAGGGLAEGRLEHRWYKQS